MVSGQLPSGPDAGRTELVVENGACTGIIARQNGASVRIDARAVVIEDGGFAANSQMVAQYITPDELNLAFARIHALLKPTGRFVLGDVLRRRTTALTDAIALLRFGGKHGFFKDAVKGLLRTAMSDYRRLRTRLGLSRYREAEMIDKLQAAGFSAARAKENLGHNRKRMTFVAVPSKRAQ